MIESNSGKNRKSIAKSEIKSYLLTLQKAYEKKLDISIKLEADCEIVLEKLKEVDLKYGLARGQKEPVSVRVLKRIFSIIPYDAGFSFKTLSTMTHFLGYKDWDDFVRECDDNKPIHCDKIYNLYKLDSDDDNALMSLETGTKIRFELGSSNKSFIVEKNDDHSFSYTILSITGLKLRRKVGDTFYAPYFIVKNDEKTNESIVLIEDDGWFDEPENEDIKCQEDYCIL